MSAYNYADVASSISVDIVSVTTAATPLPVPIPCGLNAYCAGSNLKLRLLFKLIFRQELENVSATMDILVILTRFAVIIYVITLNALIRRPATLTLVPVSAEKAILR